MSPDGRADVAARIRPRLTEDCGTPLLLVRVPGVRLGYMAAKMACVTSVGVSALVSISISKGLRPRTAS